MCAAENLCLLGKLAAFYKTAKLTFFFALWVPQVVAQTTHVPWTQCGWQRRRWSNAAAPIGYQLLPCRVCVHAAMRTCRVGKPESLETTTTRWLNQLPAAEKLKLFADNLPMYG